MSRTHFAGRIKIMSIVVAVKKAGKVVIAADTLYSFGNTKVSPTYLTKRSKIHHIGNSYIGLTGASAHDNVFPHLIQKHSKHISFDNKEEIFETYLKMHQILRDEYFLNTYDEDSGTYEPSKVEGLIINPNGIFGMYERREVYEFERFWAMGSGEEYALGSLYSIYELFDEPEKIAELAVRAGCEFDDGCNLPLELYSLDLEVKDISEVGLGQNR
jgi:ATP-dependent HslUV protease, peptidase subunit HslV